MIRLYYVPQTRATRPRWMLEELGVPYELVQVPRSLEERKNSDYIKIHPHGRVPALVDGEVTLFESAAICLYLADKFLDKGLAPPIDSPARGLYFQWAFYSMVTFEPPLYQVYRHTHVLPDEMRSSVIVKEAKSTILEVCKTLEGALASGPYILGAQFSAADVLIGSIAVWAKSMGLLENHPPLLDYVQRLTERPAYQKSRAD